MDAILLKDLKNVTYKYKANSVEKTCRVEDIQNRIKELTIKLFNLKVEKVIDCITYTHHYDILKSIYDLANITIALMNKQQQQIDITNLAMKTKDDKVYDRQNTHLEESDIKENSNLNLEIFRIINKRKNDYIAAFGYYKDEDIANKIIKKEFDDVSNYLDFLLKINELKYSHFDNYDPLINICQNLIYELSQLVINLFKAEESKIAIKNQNISSVEGYFLLMDFINSSTLFYNNWEILVDNIKKINGILMRQSDIGLLCKMNLYKQDEAQGIFIGDVSKFIEVLKNELISDVKMAFSKFNIFDKQQGLMDIVDSVYDNSYMLSGIPAWKARKMLNDSPLLIKSNNCGGIL